MKNYKYKYYKYKAKYLELKGGEKWLTYKLIENPPKIKQIRYNNGILKYYNNMDNENLDQYSEFMLGSVTKIFTVFVVLIFQQNGLFDINDKIGKYIPSNENNNFSKITIYDLLSHTSGMKSTADSFIYKKYKNATEATETFKKEKLFISEKGTYKYSPIGYILLGTIIEKVTGKSYDKVYKEYIFDKLKMKNTGVGKTNIILYNQSGKRLSEKEFLERYLASSSGALYSCVDDLVKFAKKCFGLLDKNSKKIIKKLKIIFEQKDKDQILLLHKGKINGGITVFEGVYDEKFNFKDVYIDFDTVIGYDL